MQKMRLKMFAAAALWMAALGMTGLYAADLNVKRTDTPPKIDGILDDACWKDAARIDTLYIIGEPGKTTQEHKIYVTFDDAWLYAAYDIQQPEQRRRAPTHLKHDDYIQRDDCVKLSFDPGTDGAVYYHFKLNRANARREQRNSRVKGQVSATQKIEGWNIPWRSAVQDHRENWTAEIAVPLSLLTPVGKLDKARINLLATRNMVVTRDETVNITEVKTERLSAAPLAKSFDEPKLFIPIKGMEKVSVRAPFLPYFEGVSAGKYKEQDGRYYYDVSFKVKPFSTVAGQVKMEWEDLPENAASGIVSQTVDIAEKAGAVDVTLAVPVKALAKRTGQLRMRDAKTGELLQWEPFDKDALGALNTMFSAYLDRSYYTDEQSAKAICTIGLPESSLKDMKLIAKTDQGKIIAESGDRDRSGWSWWRKWLGRSDAAESLLDNARLDIPLGPVTTGTHAIAIHLIRPDGSSVASQALELVKRPPNPGCEWKIDRENRVVLRNGKPFFVRGVNAHLRNKSNREAAMRDIKEMGFNAVLYSDWYGSWIPGSGMDPTNTDYLDLAKKYDLFVMPWMESYGQPVTNYSGSLISLHFALIRDKKYAHMTREEKTRFWEDAFHHQLPRFLAAAERVKNHPNFLGYFIFDEPLPKKHYDQITSGREFYRKLHETDGYHPVMINFCHIPEGDEYVDWCDILAVDPYWGPPRGPDRVSSFTAKAWRRAKVKRNPIWIIPCPEVWSGVYKRAIAPRENLCQTYLALIHGAKGLWYFTYNFKWQFTADGFKRINKQLKVLAPIVLSPTVEQIGNEGKGNKFQDIQTALFRNPKGGFVMLAANRCPYPVDATFKLSNLGDKEKVRRLFAKWRVNAEGSSFSDQFEPFGVRAYQYKGKGEIKTPVEIGVAMKAHPKAVTPEPVIPVTGRPGKRNLVQNPGFELATLPGAPDYYPLSGHVRKGPRFGLPGAFLELDSAQPFEGKYCLKLKCAKPEARGNSLYFSLAPQCAKPMPYVFSAYMRADRDGAKARLSGPGFSGAKWILLTKEWKRYYVSGEISPGLTKYTGLFGIGVRLPDASDECTVWVDALQFEQGSEPTEYEP